MADADYQIISRAMIRAKARSAFDRQQPRTSHGFNPGSSALFDWLEEYDRCAAQVSHFARNAPVRVDARQVQS